MVTLAGQVDIKTVNLFFLLQKLTGLRKDKLNIL